MGQIVLNIKSQKNTAQLMSSQDLKDKFLFGIKIQKDGKDLPDSVYDFHIQAAKKELERYLSIKFDLQIINEKKDFHYDDWVSWSQVKATYPIVCPVSLQGFVANTMQVDYPIEWLTVRRTSDNELYSRLMHVLPNSYSTYHQSAALYTGFFPNMGWMGAGRHTPEYWTVQYVTGFKVIPIDILKTIGMLASIYVLVVANETLAAALGMLGGSSKSLSIDGLSESISLYINGQTGIFGARIKQYSEMLFGVGGRGGGMMDQLRDYYGSIIWTTC